MSLSSTTCPCLSHSDFIFNILSLRRATWRSTKPVPVCFRPASPDVVPLGFRMMLNRSNSAAECGFMRPDSWSTVRTFIGPKYLIQWRKMPFKMPEVSSKVTLYLAAASTSSPKVLFQRYSRCRTPLRHRTELPAMSSLVVWMVSLSICDICCKMPLLHQRVQQLQEVARLEAANLQSQLL